MNLKGLEKWPEAEPEQARQLLLKWEHLFARSNLDLGRTFLIKHQIELTDQMLPHMYNNVKAHLQEMLDIGVIRKSHSLWGSVVVLVWKKEGSLRFCIDVRKLNTWTIKDAYLLPHIAETFNSP